MNSDHLLFFVTESNRIEGIARPPTKGELDATEHFLGLDYVRTEDVEEFVHRCQPNAVLRDKRGLDVRVGDHIPPSGSSHIRDALERLLEKANDDSDPYDTHVEYETLHPFTDGNGRSGRALWAWQMLRQEMWPGIKLGFLHAFYYQALSHSRRKV